MEIKQTKEDTKLTLALVGRLDTNTAPQLDAVLDEQLAGVTDLIIDLEALDYVSSAGLRSFLAAMKKMTKQGSMKLIHVNDTVMEVLEITGFADILTIE